MQLSQKTQSLGLKLQKKGKKLEEMGVIMPIRAKSSCNHYLILCFLHQIFKKIFNLKIN
jgi:hypothetical protein